MPQVPRDPSALWIFAGFVAVAIVLLVIDRDDPGTRAAAIFALVFFGGLGVVYWWLTRPRTSRSLPARPALEVAPAPGGARLLTAGRDVGIVAAEARGRLGVAALGCGVFIASGALMVWWGPPDGPGGPGGFAIVGVITIVVFVGLLAVAVAGMARNRALTLSPDGVLSRQAAGSVWVPWSDIVEVAVHVVSGHAMVGLVLGPQARVTGMLRLLRPLQRRLIGCDVTVPAPGPFHPDSLARTLARFTDHPRSRAVLDRPEGVTTVRGLALAPRPDRDGGV